MSETVFVSFWSVKISRNNLATHFKLRTTSNFLIHLPIYLFIYPSIHQSFHSSMYNVQQGQHQTYKLTKLNKLKDVMPLL